MEKIDYKDIIPTSILYFSSPGGHLDQILILVREFKVSSLLVTDEQISTKENLDISYGVYFFVMESKTFESQSGKFAIIK